MSEVNRSWDREWHWADLHLAEKDSTRLTAVLAQQVEKGGKALLSELTPVGRALLGYWGFRLSQLGWVKISAMHSGLEVPVYFV